MIIHQLGAELFHWNEQTDRETDMTKPKVTFHNFANISKNYGGKLL